MLLQSDAYPENAQAVIGRETERSSILDFVAKCESSRKGGSMYICGSPGVGKTLCVKTVFESWLKSGSPKTRAPRAVEYINVIGLRDNLKVFTAIEHVIKGSSFVSQIRKRGRSGQDDIGETFAQVSDCVDSVVSAAREYAKKPLTLVFVIDEIDYLCPSLSAVTRGGASKASMAAKRQVDLVTNLFSLPQRLEGTNVCLAIVGIANSIDLSAKLTMLRTKESLFQSTVVFRPYTASELKAIVTEMAGDELDPVAVEVCSRKVAALHGDCRKVIDLCKQAKSRSRTEAPASVRDLMSVMETAYKSQSDSSVALKALPLQQLLVLVAACRHASSQSHRTEFPLVDLKQAFTMLIKALNIPATTVGPMSSLMEHVIALSNSGLMTVKNPPGSLGKNRNANWWLNCPPDQLQATLVQTSGLVASALDTGPAVVSFRE